MIDERLSRIEHELRIIAGSVRDGFIGVRERLISMSNQIDSLIQQLNDNTNMVAAKLDHIAAVQQQTQTVTPEQINSLQSIADHLRSLGADNANPVPTPPPLAVGAPPAGSAPADPKPSAS